MEETTDEVKEKKDMFYVYCFIVAEESVVIGKMRKKR
jgi:hypothetical protein